MTEQQQQQQEPNSSSETFHSVSGSSPMECFATGKTTSGFEQSSVDDSLYPKPYPSPNPNPNNNSVLFSSQKTGNANTNNNNNNRAGKRKSRASTNKPPIKIFSADAENFMAMVQKLTGIPSETYNFFASPHALLPIQPPPLPHHHHHHLRMQGLPTLDTSAFFLGDKLSGSGDRLNDTYLPLFSNFQPPTGQLDSSQPFSFSPKMGGNTHQQALESHSFPSLSTDSKFNSLLHYHAPNMGAGALPYLWDSEKGKQDAFTDQLIRGHGLLPMGSYGKNDGTPSNDSILSGLTRSSLDSRLLQTSSCMDSSTNRAA